MNFGYEKYNADVISATDKKRICGYFVVSDLHKITPADLRLKTEELFEEIAKHEDWILESIVWDANHKVDTNREGLNTILGKAKNDEFDILLVHHMTLISRQGGKAFDYAVQLYMLDKPIYGIIEGMCSMEDLANTLHISAARCKRYEKSRGIVMYRIDFEDISEAAGIIYCFMTIPTLTNPECTIWSESGFPNTVTNSGTGFMTEQEFCRMITSTDFAAISCVAATDKADKRRVVLSLMPDTDYLVLNFPSSKGKPNEAERKILQLLGMYDG